MAWHHFAKVCRRLTWHEQTVTKSWCNFEASIQSRDLRWSLECFHRQVQSLPAWIWSTRSSHQLLWFNEREIPETFETGFHHHYLFFKSCPLMWHCMWHRIVRSEFLRSRIWQYFSRTYIVTCTAMHTFIKIMNVSALLWKWHKIVSLPPRTCSRRWIIQKLPCYQTTCSP